jgi:tetratricopeptide (TPR) repeat protein
MMGLRTSLFQPLRTAWQLARRGSAVRAPALALLLGCMGCPPARTPESSRPPRAEKWYQRAIAEYRRVAMDSAYDSARQALDLVPEDPQVRLIAARVALARLEYDETLRNLKTLKGSEVASLRGRALWYKGDVERAADELDQLLADPDVNDGWAKQITALAHHSAGRKPFEMSATEGGVASVEMSRVAPGGHPLYVVPVEINGEPALTLVATGTAEVMIDSGSSKEPSWISMRFGRRLEVRDVPALAQDLSGLSQQLGAPIKALLGANLLRHLNVTLDYRGRQFVARMFAPAPPPVASRVDVFYLRGGGMIVGSALGADDASSPLLIDTSMGFPVALDAGGWKKVGIAPSSLQPLQIGTSNELRQGAIPAMKLGAFTLPEVPAVSGPSFERLEKELEVDLDGAVGAGLLASFRITLSDGGRVMWVEQAPPVPKAPPIDLNDLVNEPMTPVDEVPFGQDPFAPGGMQQPGAIKP